jgi:hypothetical protein
VTEAVASAQEVLADELRHGPLTSNRSFDITDEHGRVLATVALDDCLHQTPCPEIGKPRYRRFDTTADRTMLLSVLQGQVFAAYAKIEPPPR